MSQIMATLQGTLTDQIWTLVVGTVAVAVALAFGLGCRDLAADTMRGWVASVRRADE